MTLKENISLKHYNSFGIDVQARFFLTIENIEQAQALYLYLKDFPEYMILGAGCNTLFTKDYKGLVVHTGIKGIEVVDDDDENITLKIGAGEQWIDLVEYCVQNSYSGIENLAYIPGLAGSAPVQNIGAYGVELKDVFHSLEAVSLETGEKKVFLKQDCKFGYRQSIFKSELKNEYLICSINLILNKDFKPNLSYAALSSYFENKKINLQSVFDAVVNIRKSKLPEIDEIGNAGSFFKNPVVDLAFFKNLQMKYPFVPYYQNGDFFKVPAAWLIEQCGWKNVTGGRVGVYSKQALVIINKGNASGKEIFDFAKAIQKSVWNKFSIPLEFEVQIL